MFTYKALKQILGNKVELIMGSPPRSLFNMKVENFDVKDFEVIEFEPRITCRFGKFVYAPPHFFKTVIYVEDNHTIVVGHNNQPLHETFRYLRNRELGSK